MDGNQPNGQDGPANAAESAFFAAESELLGDDGEPEAVLSAVATSEPELKEDRPASTFFASQTELLGDDDEQDAPASPGFFAPASELIGDDEAPADPAPVPTPQPAPTPSQPPTPSADAETPLDVTVVHGNLSFARYPLAVGHYTGDTINGAEKRVDQLLDQRLSEKRQLGLYPGPIGTSDVFLHEDGGLRGAIVVGLGDVGALTAARLERSFTQAVLEYASSVAELRGRPGGDVLSAGIATLLIGSGRGGINVEDSIRAILRGTLEARRALSASSLGNRVRIDRLEFMELYEDLAIRATRVLLRLQDEGRYAFHLADGLTSGTGGRRRASFGEEEGWWDRVVVRSEGGRLVFQTPTQRAREEKRTVPQQQRLVSQFIASAVKDHGRAPEIPKALFELLLPNDLKDYEPDRNDVVMVVDQDTARFPWELLRSSTERAELPMSVRRGLIRQFATAEFRRNVSTPPGDNVLIVADPPTTRFKPLNGARQEAETVREVFRSSGAGYAVTAHVGEGFERIIASLFARPWRILHLAAHGVLRHVTAEEKEAATREGRAPVPVTGVVLADDVFLQPAEVEQMRHVPEVVFINCCHVGAIDPAGGGAPELAASLAEQLIRMGVRAVVAAGWAVEDEAAALFARTFYERMLGGQPFGRAVHAARQETFEQHRDVNTWGAYQCYGDHGYVLARQDEAGGGGAAAPSFTCASEAIADLENLTGDAETTSGFGLGRMQAQLRALETAVLPRWAGDPGIRAGLARAASRVGLYRKAIGHYRRLARLDEARYPVEALEQFANLESRFAVALWRQRRAAGRAPHTERVRRRMLNALDRLERLPGNEQRSAERWSLIGSAHKRLSQVEPGADRLARLEQMAASYRHAADVAQRRRGRVNPYPTRNWLSAELLLHYLRDGTATPAFDAWKRDVFGPWMDRTDAAVPADEHDVPSFWTALGVTEGNLIRWLADGTLADHVDAVLGGYARAWRRGGPALALHSVLEHLDWLIDILAPDPAAPDATRAALAGALRRIRDGVDALATGAGAS